MKMRGARPPQGSGLAAPFTLSALLHAAIATLLFNSLKERKPVALPPMYRVNIVAAPPGERAIGEVKTQPQPATTPVTQPTPAPSTIKESPLPKAKTAPKAVRATPTETKAPSTKTKASTPSEAKTVSKTKTAAPKAGGGPTGDKGTDVATVRAEGIEFPFPGYLNNIVRQIALKFKPRNPAARLRAEVRFLIHRDGSVSDIQFIRKSGNFSFDLEAQGAVEAASSMRAFGPLPAGFPDDVLPVVFSFDPEFLK
ncbi:MAG TPA: TonB C-terminal domain-containing protein [Gemmatimonadaceae bacterium]|nr:TonB C-terminal domain-containing protein [Gemmatimonadaceae bacterium]